MTVTTTDSLSTYISLAKKTIAKFAAKFYNGLSTEMLKSEEAVSDVATAIMYADWRFDPNRPGKSGQQKTLYSYRNQCAIWAIQTYVTNKYKKRKHYSIDNTTPDDMSHAENIPDHRQDNPLENLIVQEENSILSDSIEKLLNSSLLSYKQQQQIRMYYFEDKTLSEIGKVFGVSREAVRQNIKRGLDIIRAHDGN
jgi:RNA polymerase sigma factor (sigma-70 family)